MGLTDSANQLVREYSGGMIRRLEIAQSMLHRPRVLFLDEPTIGLDPVARNSVWEHIGKLRNEFGTTIFFTTHLMEEADALCIASGSCPWGTWQRSDRPGNRRPRWARKTPRSKRYLFISPAIRLSRRGYRAAAADANGQRLG